MAKSSLTVLNKKIMPNHKFQTYFFTQKATFEFCSLISLTTENGCLAETSNKNYL
jgi:hypothetical protein